MRTENLRRTAIHEAGHFVFAKMMGLGDVLKMTIEPTIISGERANGHILRKPLAMDLLLSAEQRGQPLENVLRTDGDVAADVGAYRANRYGFVNQIVIQKLAGVAAETELSDGDGSLLGTDYFGARDAALVIMPPAATPAFLARRLAETRELCRGELRHTILAVAERLLSRRTMLKDDLDALWAEVDPRVIHTVPDGTISLGSPWACSGH